MTDWYARADAIAAKSGDAHAPNNWYELPGASTSPYVRLVAGKQMLVLKVFAIGVPDSPELLVLPGTFNLKDRQRISVVAAPLSKTSYRRHWLLHTSPGQLTIAGLVIVLLGQAIQISLDIGAHWAIFNVGSAGISLLDALKDLMTFGGAALAAWQVVLNS